jgi:ketosteroid isomerase-like protein
VSLENNQSMITGRAAIEKNLEAYISKRKSGTTTVYDVMDAFGCDNFATEVGKITRKDSTGKIIYTGKYMAVWEKRNDQWICIRDISNDDIKEK